MKKLTCLLLFLSLLCLIACESIVTEPDVELSNPINAEFYVDGVAADESTAVFDQTLFEPGACAYETITVKNVGAFAINFEMNIRCREDNCRLSEVLRLVVVDQLPADLTRETLVALFDDSATTLPELEGCGTLMPDEETTFTVVAYFPTEAGDLITQQDVANCSFAPRLFVTQFSGEEDSFGSDYDTDAAFDSSYGE
jgi:hypothetical protein